MWRSSRRRSAPAYANRLIARDYEVTTRITAGSTSIRAFEQPLREAAAVARAMLCAAAAERWGVSAAECDTDGGFVVHEGKRLGFGEVSADAAGLAPARDAAAQASRRRQARRASRCPGSTCPPSPTAACASPATCACRE